MKRNSTAAQILRTIKAIHALEKLSGNHQAEIGHLRNILANLHKQFQQEMAA